MRADNQRSTWTDGLVGDVRAHGWTGDGARYVHYPYSPLASSILPQDMVLSFEPMSESSCQSCPSQDYGRSSMLSLSTRSTSHSKGSTTPTKGEHARIPVYHVLIPCTDMKLSRT